jgi:hypothetical protein
LRHGAPARSPGRLVLPWQVGRLLRRQHARPNPPSTRRPSRFQPGAGGHHHQASQRLLSNPSFQSNHGRVPINHGRVPINYGRVPINYGRVPINRGRVPINSERVPINRGRVPINRGRVPINHGVHRFQPGAARALGRCERLQLPNDAWLAHAAVGETRQKKKLRKRTLLD